MLLVALPILSAYGEPEPLMEDPFGIIGAAPTPVGGQTLALGLGYTRARNGANRDLYGGALEAEAGLVRGLDLRFAQTAEYGPAAPYPADDASLACVGKSWKKMAGARRLVFLAPCAPPMGRQAGHRKAGSLLAC